MKLLGIAYAPNGKSKYDQVVIVREFFDEESMQDKIVTETRYINELTDPDLLRNLELLKIIQYPIIEKLGIEIDR